MREPAIRRIYSDIFKRFKLHYFFKEVFTNPNKGNEKGSVEAGIKFMRRNLLVPVPEFKDMSDYNKQLLAKSTQLHKREHYIVKDMIIDLHFDDLHELLKLPPTPFETTTVAKYNLDNFGRLTLNNQIFYYLSPELAFKKVQVKTTPRYIEIFADNGNFIMQIERIYGKNGTRWINWAPYIRLLANKPAAILNFSFMELFTDQEVIDTICSFHRTNLYAFLNNFADLIDKVGIDKPVGKVNDIL